ncbi:hypothetical protein COV82_02060 [Candidatus Peregrinibacteria bacterium CG11_big_fil_rev_8_21_14_0_20_46_8]|nr:MAG: hypothetical protein COV82_02060 [Candidatus Peregrinibacteria bacterium CG11_big_fil_rev_8_21_14_0_20_46_8]
MKAIFQRGHSALNSKRHRSGTAFGSAATIPELQKRLTENSIFIDVISKINALMTTATDFEEFCIEVTGVLKSTFRFKYIQIWIPDEQDTKMLRLVTPDESGTTRRMLRTSGIVGRAIQNRKPELQTNVHSDPDYINVHADTKSELCIPFLCENNVIGAINIEAASANNFEKQKEILQMIADNIGYAMKVTMLRQTELYFKAVVEQMNEGVWVGDKNECTLYTNAALQKMIGRSEKELIGMSSFDLFDENSKPIIEIENKKRKRGEQSHYEAKLITKEGGTVPVVLHAVPFESGTMATITNLHEIQDAKEKLKNAERYLASIAQNCIDAIIGVDYNNTICSWNLGAERMYGYKASEIIGEPVTKMVPRELIETDESAKILAEAKKRGFVRNFETLRVHKNGKQIPVLVTISAIKNDGGKVIGYSILHKDITAEKKWQFELQGRFEKMQDAYREMGLQRRHLDYIVEILNLALEGNRTIQQIGGFIVNAMAMITKADAVTLRLYNQKTARLELLAQNGVGESWWGKKAIKFSGSILEEAAAKGAPLKILDIINHPKYTSPALARKMNLRSALVVPLIAKKSAIGSMTIYLSDEKNLSLLDNEFIEIFARQTALAILADVQCNNCTLKKVSP